MSVPLEAIINTYEASLEQQIATYQSGLAFQGQNPTRKPSKKELLDAHSKNRALLERPLKRSSVKELILPVAYAPSAARLSDLQKVPTQSHLFTV